jgi:hypothetical protein
MVSNIEKLASKKRNRERSKKIAQIIWVGVGFALALCAITCLVLGVIINNIGSTTGVNTHSPFIGLIEAQTNFKEWWNGWMFIKMSSFLGLGTWLLIIACAYELIVFAVYASKEDANEKKEKARKIREKNAMKFKEDQAAAQAKIEEERKAAEARLAEMEKANEVPAVESSEPKAE